MADSTNYNKVSVLVVGAGPAGLSAAITLKKQSPGTDVCVIDKAAEPGNHNLSGAVLEPGPIHELLDMAAGDWREDEEAQKLFSRKVDKDDVLFLAGKKASFSMMPAIKAAKACKIGFGQMVHEDDYIVSISSLTGYLAGVAKNVGVELMTGFAAEDILLDSTGKATGVKLVDQGRGHDGEPLPNFVPGEVVEADAVVLAEGCDGLLTEKFIEKAGLKREATQLYSIGVKENIKVTDEQYAKFTDGRVVHAMGYPIWTPVIGPAMFGGGIMYPMGDNKIAVGMIVGLDWKYYDFNPQDALERFKEHKFVKQFVDGGTVVEGGAKMIPEGGYFAIPREGSTDAIGKANTVILGDSAGFVNMNKIKGLHNAISSGLAAGKAITSKLGALDELAVEYTRLVEEAGVLDEMRTAKNFRQTVAKFGPLQGMPFSVFGGMLPKFDIEPDYEVMTSMEYRLRPDMDFDKDTFTAMADTEHREEQPSHLSILDPAKCDECGRKFERPCITFCPAGVYEMIHDVVKPANPSNCLHCKTCQRKCPFDNIRWTVPEGGGGPRYKTM
ncbi:Electron transfer flavoprotein-ubiquinone oxidoreductase [Anaerohalosphaera lusitana]|uniref:Electron transfer flavoprotein-ubiquinone oxidoreductase n=1 Tax=Anaerohalosphaera lusitana TaxID=1936003 RepID=A0A1U9NHP5_9BACT|nr:electron-transfer flavoprotein:ubiquinone oxidoreductase [Anaerohalosphaera lusitana]AQT67443.1 Electron transfer flavoprotein-ubiquinone oxidoreductase [Anaerohalosphaera lusitana]